jgi:hypothetical protein
MIVAPAASPAPTPTALPTPTVASAYGAIQVQPRATQLAYDASCLVRTYLHAYAVVRFPGPDGVSNKQSARTSIPLCNAPAFSAAAMAASLTPPTTTPPSPPASAPTASRISTASTPRSPPAPAPAITLERPAMVITSAATTPSTAGAFPRASWPRSRSRK